MDEIVLSLDNIYEGDGSDFFQDDNEETKVVPPANKEEEKPEETKDNVEITEDNLFEDEDNPEVVGDETKNKETNGGTTPKNVEPSSPNTYSSIASAFKKDGVPLFSNAKDSEISEIKDSESFRDFLEKKIQSEIDNRFEDTERRVKEALEYGTHPSDIQLFESSLAQLNSIKEEDITDESENGENLRKNLIYRDYINKGFSEEIALKKTQRSFDTNNDVEDAKDALESNKQFYQTEYDKLIAKNKEESKAREEKAKQQAKELKKSILEDKDGFGGFEVSQEIRRKVYETINKPVAKNDEGVNMTTLQKFAEENPTEFMKYVGYFFVVTDGFKTIGNIEKSVEQKASKKQMKAFEQAINSTQRNADGSLKFVANLPSVGSNDWQLDI